MCNGGPRGKSGGGFRIGKKRGEISKPTKKKKALVRVVRGNNNKEKEVGAARHEGGTLLYNEAKVPPWKKSLVAGLLSLRRPRLQGENH